MKKKLINIVQRIVELIVFILLILIIINLIKSRNGAFSNENADEKLNKAIKIFSSTDGMTLKEAISNIEGLENLEINEETGEYNIKIDGQEFLVISQETIPEDTNKNVTKGDLNEPKN